jgi:hypothetical protein
MDPPYLPTHIGYPAAVYIWGTHHFMIYSIVINYFEEINANIVLYIGVQRMAPSIRTDRNINSF